MEVALSCAALISAACFSSSAAAFAATAAASAAAAVAWPRMAVTSGVEQGQRSPKR